MHSRFRKTLGRKLHLGRLGVPVWTIALAGTLVAAVAGQAVGPVLSGSVQGSAGLVVSQTVVLDTDLATGSNPATYGAVDSATTRNDEGTAFTVALETRVGQTNYVCLFLANDSGKAANAIMELAVPAGVDVEVTEFDNEATCDDSMATGGTVVNEAQLNRNTWLMNLSNAAGTGNNDGVRVMLEAKDDAAPGFYTITGRIIQVAN